MNSKSKAIIKKHQKQRRRNQELRKEGLALQAQLRPKRGRKKVMETLVYDKLS